MCLLAPSVNLRWVIRARDQGKAAATFPLTSEMCLLDLSYSAGPSLHQFEGSTLLPISMGVCLLCGCLLLPKSEYSLSKGPMNWGSHKYLDIPWAHHLTFQVTFFLSYEKKDWTKKYLQSSFHNPITWAPPLAFYSSPLCSQRFPQSLSTSQSWALPQLSASSNYWRKKQIVHKRKEVWGALFQKHSYHCFHFLHWL